LNKKNKICFTDTPLIILKFKKTILPKNKFKTDIITIWATKNVDNIEIKFSIFTVVNLCFLKIALLT
jgi:hypothetical protein